MREILFRGKRIDNGEWVCGYYVYKPLEKMSGIVLFDEMNNHRSYQVELETVGQYTGLTDKNGTKIFEGDILAVGDNRKVYQTVQVHYNNGAFRVSHFAIDVLECRNTKSEVIGNIHDCPELLKGGVEK